MQFLYPSVTSSCLGPNIILSTLFSITLNLYSSLKVRDQVLHHMKQIKLYVCLNLYQYPFLHPIVVLLYIKEQRFHHTQYIYIINNVELNSGQHVSITQDHLQALRDTFLILKQNVTCHCLELHITKVKIS
jgi:hypothetical protein